MPYALSFSEEFFLPADPQSIDPSDRPTSVYQAIIGLEEWVREEIAVLVLRRDDGKVDPMELLSIIRMTNTCDNLDPPVRVWIDLDGTYRLEVYDDADSRPDPAAYPGMP